MTTGPLASGGLVAPRLAHVPPADKVRFDYLGDGQWRAFTKTWHWSEWKPRQRFSCRAEADRRELVEAWTDAFAAED